MLPSARGTDRRTPSGRRARPRARPPSVRAGRRRHPGRMPSNPAQGESFVTVGVVIIGRGYVGLPLAQEATRAGMSVLGFDINAGVVEGLNQGLSHVDDLTDADIAEMVAGGFRATNDEA